MSQIKKTAKALPGWTVEGEALWRTFTFDHFLKGIDFVENVAAYSEGAQHHPVITIDHTAVSIKWTTVDEGKLTQKDIDAAKACNQFFEN
ncbi:4a-hydroxytetrahydrobiopterin dehydratase [Shouchella rhizosphaerae]|uniref:4a-hydroxytetrahydrobiopterin dehydratase n=1 Tax=Shouchella rhizosphaerae TaxID=866786 RepID=UPI003F7EC918